MLVKIIHTANGTIGYQHIFCATAHLGTVLADNDLRIRVSKHFFKLFGGPNGTIFGCAPSTATVTAS